MFDTVPAPDPAPALQQSETFQKALSALGRDCQRVGRALWVTRRWSLGPTVTTTLRAPLYPGIETILEHSDIHRHVLLLSPDHPAPWLAGIGALPVMTPAHVAEWMLDPDRDRMMARLHQKWRNRLRAAFKSDLVVERQLMPLRTDHWLYRAEAKLSRQRGYRNWPPALTAAYADARRKDAQLFTASRNGALLGAVLVLRHGTAATYHIGSTSEAGKRYNAHNLLLWHAANWLAEAGVTRFDLGTLDTRRAPGLARFKLGTGATLRSLGGTWALWHPLRRLLRPIAALDQKAMRG